MEDIPAPSVPLLSPKIANIVWLIYTVCSLVVLPVIAIAFDGPQEIKVLAISNAIVSGLGNLLRMLTTNSFKVMVPVGAASAVLLVMAIVMVNCAGGKLTPFGHRLVDCGEQAIAHQLPSLVNKTECILAGLGPTCNGEQEPWDMALDGLVAVAGDAAVCAIRVVVAELEGPPPVGSASSILPPAEMSVFPPIWQDRDRSLMRAYSYLGQQKDGVRVMNVKP